MRIYTSASEPLDFCDRCSPTEDKAFDLYGDLGDGPDGRGNCFAYDADHPSYNDDKGYDCDGCGKRLVEPASSSWFAAYGKPDLDGTALATR